MGSKAREEAERIVDIYKSATTYKIQRYAGATPEEFIIDEYAVLKCALIHVEGIINEIDKYNHTNLPDIRYWQEVKQELNKMIN